MPRFFVPSPQLSEEEIRILGDDAHHIARSLRMAEGDTLTVCDMHGGEYTCVLSRIRDEKCICRILEKRQSTSESPLEITLFMAYPKADKLETIVQKATELGVSHIVPFESSRCIKRPKAEKADRVRERLSKIAEEAAKQSGRAKIPTVSDCLSFSEVLSLAKSFSLPLFCYEGETTVSLRELLASYKPEGSIAVVVGCEGGFSLDEFEKAKAAGFLPTGLGRRILRCETAPLFVLSSICYQFEL